MKPIYLEKPTNNKGQTFAFITTSTTNHLFNRRDEKLSSANTFLSQNKGNGPPGKSDSLEVPDCNCLIDPQVLPNLIAMSNLYIPYRAYKLQIFNHLNINKHN